MNDIKLTEKALKEIWDISGEFNFKDTFIKIQQKGWIVKNDIEQAIDEANKFYEYQFEFAGQYFDKLVVIELSEKYINVIDLLQKRIKELEAK